MNLAERSDDSSLIFDNETANATILDENNDKENPHETENPPEETTPLPAADKRITLNMVLREALFFLALALTTYDALQNSPPKISRTPTAVPFFEKGSLVTDWYKGQVSTALSFISLSEVSFVMYYAPWDAESQHVRKEFNMAAQTLFKQVHFAAINCWHPGGECRLHHNKIATWPIIMVYTTHLKSIMYTGPRDAASMVRFLRQVTRPIQRITNTEELVKLMAVCDAVVVGFTPINDKINHYYTLYNVALKSLEFDPFGDVCFTVVTSESLAEEMGVEYVPNIRLMVWNETLEYPEDLEFKVDGIMQWVWGHMAKKVAWYTPQWQKSFSMQKVFSMGPVLILFTPRNHYYEEIPNFSLLQEVALEYNNCDNPWNSEMAKVSALQRRNYIEYERNITSMCAELSADMFPPEYIPKAPAEPPVNKVPKKSWLNRTMCKSELNGKTLQSFLFREHSNAHTDVGSGSVNVVSWPGYCCKNEEQDSCSTTEKTSPEVVTTEELNTLIKKLAVEDSNKSFKTSMLVPDHDPRSPINLQKRRMREICVLLALGRKLHPQVYPALGRGPTGVEGLACKTNRSLLIFAIDSMSNHHFAESLGIDVLNAKDHTAAVILDNESESQYVLHEPFGENSIREFIYNYTQNILPRDLKTIAVNAEYTHFYGADKMRRQVVTGKSKNFRPSANPWCRSDTSSGEVVCITELNTANFKDFIMQRDKAILVALCGAGSGACGGLLSLALLGAARLLQAPGLLQIGRIDPSRHDLPWQYTVAKYPTLVLFPMRQKEESRSYPENQAITIEGVLAFILSGIEPPLKLHAKVLLCNQTQDDESMKECLTNVRFDTVSLIGKTLRQWRRFRDTPLKSLLLKRLQCLRSLAITLGSLNTTKLPPSHPVISSFNDSIKLLTQIWNLNIPILKVKNLRLTEKSANLTLL